MVPPSQPVPHLIKLFSYRNDIEAIWDSIVSGTPIPAASESLVIESVCKTKDANISLRQFIQFW